MITKKLGDGMLFSGGNEVTPAVSILKADNRGPFSMQDPEEKVIKIDQGFGKEIIISEDTLRAILHWATK